MHVQIELIVLNIDFNNGTSKCLLTDDDTLPVQTMSKLQPIQLAPKILNEFLEINPTWVNFVLLDVILNDDILSIYYTCMIPNVIKNLKGSWKEIGSIYDKNTQKLVLEAGQRIISRFG